MRLADRRKVIEVLLCAGDECSGLIDINDACGAIADAIWSVVAGDPGRDTATYEDDALEAAYRLIESSQTLCLEWFGAHGRSGRGAT